MTTFVSLVLKIVTICEEKMQKTNCHLAGDVYRQLQYSADYCSGSTNVVVVVTWMSDWCFCSDLIGIPTATDSFVWHKR